jgi:serine/threonine-protein kinase
VYLARSLGAKGFSRLVAIKRLHPHLESEEDFVQMFIDEARLAARIRHPNVVATLDVEDTEGLYIVMEYIEGVTLLTLSRAVQKLGERVPVPVAMRIALDILGGLHAAHELLDDDGRFLNLVHRDVSPQNILVGTDGIGRVLDFGIAKATSRLQVTVEGQLKGKLAYMAPEQLERHEVDRRVDVWATGVVLWELLTGRRLFVGDHPARLMKSVLTDEVPRPSEIDNGISRELDDVVMKALQRDPDQPHYQQHGRGNRNARKRVCTSVKDLGHCVLRKPVLADAPASPRGATSVI